MQCRDAVPVDCAVFTRSPAAAGGSSESGNGISKEVTMQFPLESKFAGEGCSGCACSSGTSSALSQANSHPNSPELVVASISVALVI